MRSARLLLPCLPAAALAACGSSSTASVQLDPNEGWSGTAEVFVHRPDGSMVSRAPITTTADVAVADGDTISVAFHDAGKIAMTSVMGVSAGDVIELQAYPLSDFTFVTTTVDLPAVAGATMWELSTPNSYSSTNDTTTPPTIDVLSGKTSVPILAAAESASGVLSLFGSTSAPIDPTGPTISLTGTVAWQPVTVAATHVPTGLTAYLGGQIPFGNEGGLTLPIVGDTVAAPAGFGDRLELLAVVVGQADITSASATFGSAPSGPVSLDVSVPDLPQIGAPTLAPDHASWTLTGGGAYDSISAFLSSSTNDRFHWGLAAPPGTATLVLPQLPADLGAPAFDRLSVAAYERSDVDGYHDALHASLTFAPGAHDEERSVETSAAAASAAPRDRGKLGVRVPLPALGR
jgi:hypothetical protein